MDSNRSFDMAVEKQTSLNNIECGYLFHQHRERSRYCSDTPHTHPFWHVDIIHHGSGFFAVDGHQHPFSAGDTVIIPEGIKHIFSYPGECEWLSIKFSVENYNDDFMPVIFQDDPLLSKLKSMIKELLPRDRVPDNSMQAVINSILKIFIQLFEIKFGHVFRAHSEFLDRIFEFVAERNGKYVPISDIADLIGFSVKYTADRFRKEAGCTLKHYLDEERFKHARRLLSYSNASVTNIAEQLEFPDVYAFSRFFKHWAKQSPRQFREHQLKDL